MTQKFRVKSLPDGRAMLNIACGTRMHRGWNNMDFSPYALLARHRSLARLLRSVGMLSAQRLERLAQIDPDIIRWDLRRGIPFDDGTFDVVYHSHFLEHIDRHQAPGLLRECGRVLKPGGVLRVVVPDLEMLVGCYTQSLRAQTANEAASETRHEEAIAGLFDQMVRRESSGTVEQSGWRQSLERRVRGGADATGELHRWMYDRYSLAALLRRAGFRESQAHGPASSRVGGWAAFHLDTNEDGSTYKPESLYMEGVK